MNDTTPNLNPRIRFWLAASELLEIIAALMLASLVFLQPRFPLGLAAVAYVAAVLARRQGESLAHPKRDERPRSDEMPVDQPESFAHV